MRRWFSFLVTLSVAFAVLSRSGTARADRLRDIADVAGARENQLVGYGIVTGLAGTGDDSSVPFAGQSTLSLLRRLGIQVDPKQLRLKNVAAVIVTATLPAFAKPGTKIDVTVSSIGNAKSLSGGTLIQSVLKGADQKTYAVAQGGVLVGGFEARGASGSSTKSGSTTAGRVPEGALVEREVLTTLVEGGLLKWELRTPGFAVAQRIAEAIEKKLGPGTAKAPDGGVVVVKVPAAYDGKVVELVSVLEELDVTVVRRARVVINERTGTIVAGGDVRLSPAAVVHGSLTIVVKETPTASQPKAPVLGSAAGTTVVVPKSDVQVNEGNRNLAYVPGAATLADVATALGKLGLSPRELTSVLQALRGAGVLEAELVIQ
ncbi:MAG: flagellar basal body P-ring protein FlgI [Polyangiaceae bacterium]|nr:flagellar basal body P-ring protein FlgI [Polyangiaceae bacterium]